MTSARSVALSFFVSLAALAALALSAHAATPGNAAGAPTGISFALNHGFQNRTSLNFASCTGSGAVAAAPFAGATESSNAAGERSARLRFRLRAGATQVWIGSRKKGFSPAPGAGHALRRGRRGVDGIEF